jgi:hypothetical protein
MACKNVPFSWFLAGKRSEQRAYAELIEGYDTAGEFRRYAECYIDELFSKDEAQQLIDYLDLRHDSQCETTMHEEPLPIANDAMGIGAVPAGNSHGFYMLCEEPKYSLPLKVWGHFDLVGCELADGSGVFGHLLRSNDCPNAEPGTNEFPF